MDSWPTWARELNLDTKWAEGAQVLEVDGCTFLVVSRYGLDKSATIALIADATEYDFRFSILPHPDDGGQVQILVWNVSEREAKTSRGVVSWIPNP